MRQIQRAERRASFMAACETARAILRPFYVLLSHAPIAKLNQNAAPATVMLLIFFRPFARAAVAGALLTSLRAENIETRGQYFMII
jgi:hypothetical protein